MTFPFNGPLFTLKLGSISRQKFTRLPLFRNGESDRLILLFWRPVNFLTLLKPPNRLSLNRVRFLMLAVVRLISVVLLTLLLLLSMNILRLLQSSRRGKSGFLSSVFRLITRKTLRKLPLPLIFMTSISFPVMSQTLPGLRQTVGGPSSGQLRFLFTKAGRRVRPNPIIVSFSFMIGLTVTRCRRT